jgi:DNA-binding NtrC family response regulator/tetratricopeptide (TPR) repeat protein
MLTVAEHPGPNSAIALLSEVRKKVTQAADPQIVAALHLFLAEIETKRGAFSAVQRHINTGKRLLESQPNLWLEGVAATSQSCLCFLESDIEKADTEARRGLELAILSGHAITRLASTINLSHIHLARGDTGRAQHRLSEALSMCGQGGGAEIAVLDGLAQVKLAEGDLEGAERTWSRIVARGVTPGETPSYYQVCALLTRAKVLLTGGRHEQASSFLSQALEAACRTADPSVVNPLRLAKAEALAMQGKLSDAADLIYQAAEATDPASVDIIAEVQRVAGKVLARAGKAGAAAVCFERSARILGAVGNICARDAALRDFDAAVADRKRITTERAAAAPGVLHRAAAVLDLASHPELAGREMLELLRETGCVRRARLVAGGRKSDVLADMASPAQAPDEQRADEVRMALGIRRERSIELIAEPKRDLESRLSLLAARGLLKAALSLEEHRRNEREQAALWPSETTSETPEGVFASQQMAELLSTSRKIAATNLTVLITGETGSGKEVLARAIHRASSRGSHAFLPFNCTSVPRDMLDAQLFGYRRGAFTDAHTDFPGVIRSAAGGTLFLDEIAELGHDVQPKLLRFLETGEIHPLGEARPIHVDIRVIAATNAKLEHLVSAGTFREDLFYRLNVIRFQVPPLRERREEIPLLVDRFLRQFSEEFHKTGLRVAEETIEFLLLYSWPGNVRQLANEIRRMTALAENGAVLTPEHLSNELAASRRTVPSADRSTPPSEVVVRLDQPLGAAVEHVERALVRFALDASGGRLDPAAKALGISRKGLYLKRQRLGLDPPAARLAAV